MISLAEMPASLLLMQRLQNCPLTGPNSMLFYIFNQNNLSIFKNQEIEHQLDP